MRDRDMNKTMRNVVLGLGLFVLVVICGGIGVAALSSSENKKARVHTPSARPVATKAGSASAKPKASPRPATIREGTWEVGIDIKAGKYRTKGAVEGIIPLCVWDIKSSNGDTIDFGSVDKPNAPGIVTLKVGQTFTTNGCKDWIKR